jgi:4-amino-4-deoxy-L-arabinose transferase-like glycosyltransferase
MNQKRHTLLLLSVSVLLLFWGLGARSLWAAEGRWAEIVREMLLTGDFFHPTIGGEPCFDKPLLTYWLRVIISVTTGAPNEFVVRLPSAIAGIVAIWATASIGTRLWSARVGKLAGWFLLTTYAFLFWSRTGTADAENLAFIVVAVAWYWSRRNRLGFPAILVFYLIVFVGAQTKGLTAVVVPILVVLPDMVGQRRWRLLFHPSHFLAFAIGLLVYLSPFAYASFTQASDYQSSGLGLVFQENILRYFEPIGLPLFVGPALMRGFHIPVVH